MSYKQVFNVSIESKSSVDFAGKDVPGYPATYAIVPNQPYPYFVATNETRRTIGDKIQTETANAFDAKVREEAAKNGITVSSVVFASLQYRWIETNTYTAYIFPATGVPIFSEKYALDMVIEVMSDKPFAQSPMPLWAVYIMTKVIAAVVTILIVYFVTLAAQAMWNSLFVKTQTIKVYDANGKLIEERTITEPSWASGILVIGGLIVVALIVVPVLLDRLKGHRKRAPAKRRTRK